MRKEILIKLPEGMNPNRMLTFQLASEISGFPIRMLYEWRRHPGKGMPVRKVGRRVLLPAKKFVGWANAQIRTA